VGATATPTPSPTVYDPNPSYAYAATLTFRCGGWAWSRDDDDGRGEADMKGLPHVGAYPVLRGLAVVVVLWLLRRMLTLVWSWCVCSSM
jgi:hypothetical protein